MPKRKAHPAGEAVIERGVIVIRLPVENLPDAVRLGSEIGAIDPPLRVTNAETFAADFVRALNEEDEEGTTPIHRLFDQAAMDAAEQGADGCETPEDDE